MRVFFSMRVIITADFPVLGTLVKSTHVKFLLIFEIKCTQVRETVNTYPVS